MFDDPYDKKSPLDAGSHFVMLIFFLAVVCVGFFMVKAFIFDKMINDALQPPSEQKSEKPAN